MTRHTLSPLSMLCARHVSVLDSTTGEPALLKIYHGISWYYMVNHDITCGIPWFTCFKTPWYFTMASLFQSTMDHHGFHGFHGISWYFTMASLFQSTMDHHGFHGISWYFTMVYHDLPWFTYFKTPLDTMAFTMVYFHKGPHWEGTFCSCQSFVDNLTVFCHVDTIKHKADA